MAIWVTSDWHFCHNQNFIYEPRNCQSVDEMNQTILTNHNTLVSDDDEVYVLGDLTLNDVEKGLELISQMKGKLHIVCGNHDTAARIEKYKELPNVVSVNNMEIIKYKKWTWVLSHWPTIVGNFDDPAPIYNLHGHTHSNDKFSYDKCYSVNPEAHNNKPVLLDDIKTEIIQYKQEKERS